MKNVVKIIALVTVIGFGMAALSLTGCSDGGDPSLPPLPQDPIPTAADFDIDNLSQMVGSVTAVTIDPKQGKSSGDVTVYYTGTGGTTYDKSTTPPTEVGTYTVTFNVAVATGWNAANGLSAGTLTINPTPTFNGNLAHFAAWLNTQPTNTASTPYTVKPNVSDTADFSTFRTTLNNNQNRNKYVYLDLTGSTVTSIPEYAFFDVSSQRCASLTGITIPDSVTSIGQGAFIGCTGLTSVTIPNSVTIIAQSTFAGSGLTSVTIPNSVTSIGEFAFEVCTSLTSVIIPDSVINIERQAFRGCSGLTSVTIGNSVTTIGGGDNQGAFEDCSGLISVTIGNSVTTIGDSAFFGCTRLTNVTIPNSVISIERKAFYDCTSLTSVTIGNSVTSIGELAFWGCTSLTSVIIPDSVTSIEGAAFYNCTSLRSVTFEGTIPSSGFNKSTTYFPVFPGNLRDQFYKTDSTNGTPGTYRRSGDINITWRKE